MTFESKLLKFVGKLVIWFYDKLNKSELTMPRLLLTDEQWSKLKAIILAQGIYDKANLRMTVEGILYKLRVGCPWRDLPEDFGYWNSIYKRFNDWSTKNKLLASFQLIASDSDNEWTFIDGSIVKAHQHSSGAQKKAVSAIGKSVAGKTSKIHLAVDSMGLPIHFEITGGQVHDSVVATTLVKYTINEDSDYYVADRGYDSQELRDSISKQGSKSAIPRKKNSKTGNDDIDWCLYRYRHLVENAFARLKHFRSIATRYEKLKATYSGMVSLGCILMWLPM